MKKQGKKNLIYSAQTLEIIQGKRKCGFKEFDINQIIFTHCSDLLCKNLQKRILLNRKTPLD